MRAQDTSLTVPNVLTGLRILMAVVAAACFATGVAEKQAVVLCIVAALLDAFDGWYARTFSQCSKLGEHLDPLADKLLIAVVFGVVAFKVDSFATWTLVAFIGLREVGMTVFRSYSLWRYRQFIPANRLGKVKMIVQSTVGLAIIAYMYLVGDGTGVSQVVVLPALAAILAISYLSAGVYLRAWFFSRSLRVAEVDVRGGYEESGKVAVGE